MTREPLASIQARVTCWGLAPTSVATSAKAGMRLLNPIGPPDAAQGAPGDERDAELLAVLELALRGAEAGRELVLHADQPAAEHPLGLVDLRHGGVGDAGHQDLALVEQVGQRAHGLGPRDRRVGPVVLVEADGVDRRAALSEASQASFT